jgi:hypothetical protein
LRQSRKHRFGRARAELDDGGGAAYLAGGKSETLLVEVKQVSGLSVENLAVSLLDAVTLYYETRVVSDYSPSDCVLEAVLEEGMKCHFED